MDAKARDARAEIRRAFRCSCDGVSHRQTGRKVERLGMAAMADMNAIETLTGDRPPTCPWQVFRDPDVAEVLRAYDFFESGQCAEWWGSDPPWWLVLGTRHYHRVLGTVRADAIRLERENREHERKAKTAAANAEFVITG